MKTRHLSRRPPMAPIKRTTWCRVLAGETGIVCYRLFRCDVSGAQHMAAVDFGSGVSRRHIAMELRRLRKQLLDRVDKLDFKALGLEVLEDGDHGLSGGGERSDNGREVDPPAERDFLLQLDRPAVPVQVPVFVGTNPTARAVLEHKAEALLDLSHA